MGGLIEEDGEHVDVSDAWQGEERGDGFGVLGWRRGIEDGGECEVAGDSDGEVWPLREGFEGYGWVLGVGFEVDEQGADGHGREASAGEKIIQESRIVFS